MVDAVQSTPRVSIVADVDSLALTAGGAVAGRLWLRGVGAESSGEFPESGWSDLPVALLAAWIPALYRLARTGESAACYFMDGPYHFTVAAAAQGLWRVACFEDRERPSRVSSAVYDWSALPDELLDSVARQGAAILGYCDARGWWDAHSEELRRSLEQTRRFRDDGGYAGGL